MTKTEFYKALSDVQRRLNAPKNLYNLFGKYNYRNVESIYESVKPLLNEHGLFMSINHTPVEVAGKLFIESVLTITDGENTHEVKSMCLHGDSKKGMDDAQLSGATLSYASKYVCNNTFLIDDSKDVDSDEFRNDSLRAALKAVDEAKTAEEVAEIWGSYPQLKTVDSFVKAVKNKGTQLKNQSNG